MEEKLPLSVQNLLLFINIVWLKHLEHLEKKVELLLARIRIFNWMKQEPKLQKKNEIVLQHLFANDNVCL